MQIVHFWALSALPSATVAGVDEVHLLRPVCAQRAPALRHRAQMCRRRCGIDEPGQPTGLVTKWAGPDLAPSPGKGGTVRGDVPGDHLVIPGHEQQVPFAHR